MTWQKLRNQVLQLPQARSLAFSSVQSVLTFITVAHNDFLGADVVEQSVTLF